MDYDKGTAVAPFWCGCCHIVQCLLHCNVAVQLTGGDGALMSSITAS